MKARFTPWWYFAIACLLGLLLGGFLEFLSDQSSLYLLGVPWFISALLLALGLIVLWFAWQVRRYTHGDREEINPQQAINTLIMSKALSLSCSALGGWYGGQLIMSLPHLNISYYKTAVIQCSIATAVCLLDVVIGIIAERWCRRPPSPGPEHPQVKKDEARRRQASQAQSPKKSR